MQVVDKRYLSKSFVANKDHDQCYIDNIVKSFTLNEEQERAFCIVANHATQPSGEILRMYLGGMGGTGKSQVIKALMELLETRNEAHRFMILAPTPYSAQDVNSHSFLLDNA